MKTSCYNNYKLTVEDITNLKNSSRIHLDYYNDTASARIVIEDVGKRTGLKTETTLTVPVNYSVEIRGKNEDDTWYTRYNDYDVDITRCSSTLYRFDNNPKPIDAILALLKPGDVLAVVAEEIQVGKTPDGYGDLYKFETKVEIRRYNKKWDYLNTVQSVVVETVVNARSSWSPVQWRFSPDYYRRQAERQAEKEVAEARARLAEEIEPVQNETVTESAIF